MKNDISEKQRKLEIEKIATGAYVKKGMFVAFPLHFPGITQMFKPDESLIMDLDISEGGSILGGTGKKAAHAFQGDFLGATGFVRQLSTAINDATCKAVCCHKEKNVAFVNDNGGTRVFLYNKGQAFWADPLQEYDVFDIECEDVGYISKWQCVSAVRDNNRQCIVVTTEKELLTFDVASRKQNVIAEISTPSELVVSSQNVIYGLDDQGSLWRYDVAKASLTRRAVELKHGCWQADKVRFTFDKNNVYISDAHGSVYAIDQAEESRFLFKSHCPPISTMCMTIDGRIYGFCGDDLQNMFVYNVNNQEYENLGVAASVIERRRYGYEFSASVTGKNGEIYFAECDNLGHLWIYFPPLLQR